MVEAEKEGYKLPAGLKQAWVKFQQNKARNYSGNNLYPWDELAQSYRLYTLALAGQPEMGSMNRLREKSKPIATITLATGFGIPYYRTKGSCVETY